MDRANIHLPWPEWTIVKELGHGAYGVVYQAERKISGVREEAAIKVVSFPRSRDEIESDLMEGYDIESICGKYEEKRDIKPGNIMVSQFGDFKLGDFGIARTMDHTMQATMTGTAAYMAPEIVHSEPYGKAVDIYSLGMVLYWLLNNGRYPFVTIHGHSRFVPDI